MNSQTNIHKFVKKLSDEECINLYASLFLCQYPSFTKKYAMNEAKKFPRTALEQLLSKATTYGLQMEKIDH